MAKIKGKQTSYYGPKKSGYQVAEALERQDVEVLWREGDWVYFSYQGGGKKRGGYLPFEALDGLGVVAEKSFASVTRYSLSTGWVYAAPPDKADANNITGLPIERIARGMVVSYLQGERPNNYALIEYTTCEGKRARGYFWSPWLGATLPANDMTHFATYRSGERIATGLPFAGAQVSQGFNDKTTNNKGHLGYDLLVAGGIVQAIFPGDIVGSKNSLGTSNGRVLTLRHNVNGEVFFSTYCHLAAINKTGGAVSGGEAIGIVGGSGQTEHTYASHLHLCVYGSAFTVDPFGYCSAVPSGGSYHPKTFEQTATVPGYVAQAIYYYGDTAKDYELRYPRCGGKRFYDPFGVISTNAALITAKKNSR